MMILFFCANDTLISSANFSPYVARWQSCGDETTTPKIQSSTPSVSLYPNPNNGSFTIEMKNEELRMNNRVEIYNVLGEKVYSQSTTHNSQFKIDLNQPAGLYLYRVISDNGQLIGDGKFVIE